MILGLQAKKNPTISSEPSIGEFTYALADLFLVRNPKKVRVSEVKKGERGGRKLVTKGN